jgi:hypothetical protein
MYPPLFGTKDKVELVLDITFTAGMQKHPSSLAVLAENFRNFAEIPMF